MSDEITFAGKPYVSSKRASKVSGYAQDYIGQLARSGQIEAQRIGGLWYVSMDSLMGYRKPVAGESVASASATENTTTIEQPPLTASADVESFISFDGKDYISAARAAKLTGYNQDYVGQLARSGQILARQIGNRWYVDREGIINHKNEKDALLAAVQAESVGLQQAEVREEPHSEMNEQSVEQEMKYFPDQRDLLPTPQKPQEPEPEPVIDEENAPPKISIPIRLIKHVPIGGHSEERRNLKRTEGRSRFAQTGVLAAAALTVVIVLSFGITSLKSSSTYVLKPLLPDKQAFTASVVRAFDAIGSQIESFVSPEIVYRRE